MATEKSDNLAVGLATADGYNLQSELDIRQMAVKGVIWSAAQKYGERAISFVVLLLLAHLLSPTSFGLVALASVFISFAQIFVDQGFGDAVVQALHIDQTLLNTAFWTNLLMGISVALVSVAASEKIASFYKEPALTQVIGWLSLSFVFSALSSVQEALLRRKLNFRSLALRSLIATLGSGLVAVFLAVLGTGVWSLVTKVLCYSLISVVTLWGISDWRPGFSFSWKSFKDLYSYGINIVGAHFVDFFNRRSDDLLVGLVLGATMLGYYSLAYGLLMIVTELLIVVPNAVVFPAFARIRQDPALLRSSFYEATQIISLTTIPFFVCLVIIAPEVVRLLYGPQWTPSTPVVQVLMLVGIVHSAFFFFGSLLKAVGKPQWRFGMLAVTALLNVIGFALTVHWGIVAVAISYVCVSYLVAPFYVALVRRAIDLDIKMYLIQYVPAAVCTLAMSIVILAARFALGSSLNFYLRLIVMVLLGAITYFVCLFLVARPVFYRGWSLVSKMCAEASRSFRFRPRHPNEEKAHG